MANNTVVIMVTPSGDKPENRLTVLQTVDGASLTKTVSRRDGGGYEVQPYDEAFLFRVESKPVNSLLDLAREVGALQGMPRHCVIRGELRDGVNPNRCRRTAYDRVDEHTGELIPAGFAPCPRPYLAIDVDNIPVPVWSPDGVAARRAAIERDRAEHPPAHRRPKGPSDGEEYDFGGDADPAPIDPVHDWQLVIAEVAQLLPPEFHGVHCFCQLTGSAGLVEDKVKMRIWFWLERSVSDDEVKRWLSGCGYFAEIDGRPKFHRYFDMALYNSVQIHYTASPIFNNCPDPVPQRNGIWWQHKAAVEVPDLAPPPAPELPAPAPREMAPLDLSDHRAVALACIGRGRLTPWQTEFCEKVARLSSLTKKQAETLAGIADINRGAEAYTKAALQAVETAPAGERHNTLMSVAVRLFSLAGEGYLEPADVSRRLLASALKPLNESERRQRCTPFGTRPSLNEQAVDWARARASSSPDLPKGF